MSADKDKLKKEIKDNINSMHNEVLKFCQEHGFEMTINYDDGTKEVVNKMGQKK
tara:strand:- start:36 stop:197 length:162 start_codon:yes stop_codon:yes gene_type:complete